MTEIDFSDKSNEDIIHVMYKMAPSSDNQIAARQEWEKRKIGREDTMLEMTATLVKATDKMLTISKRALWVSIIACGSSVIAIIYTIAKSYMLQK